MDQGSKEGGHQAAPEPQKPVSTVKTCGCGCIPPVKETVKEN